MARIGLAAITSILVLYALNPTEAVYNDIFGYGALVLKEATTGLLMGFAANIIGNIILLAGNIIDMDIGLSMVSMFDPSMNTQLTITGSIYNQFVMMLFLVSDMHRYTLKAVIDSFSLIPLGGAVFRVDVLLQAMIVYFTDLFILAFRIMMPIFASMLIINVVLGVMSKVAPQMNMFAIGVQIKIIVGFLILFIMVFLFPKVGNLVFKEAILMMDNMLDGMHN